MSWIITILVGFVVGIIAKFLHPGKDGLGFIMTTLLGIGGSMLASVVGQAMGWYKVGQPAGFVASVVAAIVILAVYSRLLKK